MAMYEPFGATDWSRLAIVLHRFDKILDSGVLDDSDDGHINSHEFAACGGIPSNSNPDQLYSLKRQVKISNIPSARSSASCFAARSTLPHPR